MVGSGLPSDSEGGVGSSVDKRGWSVKRSLRKLSSRENLPLPEDTLDAHVVAQRLRALHGRAFEDVVAYILNKYLVDEQLVVVRGRQKILARAIGDADTAAELANFTKLPVKRRCTQSQLEDYPDSDLFVLKVAASAEEKYRLMGIINCKVSFHARHTETCFWGAAVRASSYIKYLCVTEDRDIYKPKRSELGASCYHPTAVRRLLECFTDRVYVIKRYRGPGDKTLEADLERRDRVAGSGEIVFDDPTRHNHTQYCHLVRPFDDLIPDLINWKRDVPR
jgi:hypothetical protein